MFKRVIKKIIIIAFILITVVSFSQPGKTALDISGTLQTNLIWEEESEQLLDEEIFILEIRRRFGFNADFLVDLQFNSYRSGKALVPDEKGDLKIIELPQAERETESEISEAYVNYYTDNIDWRLGRQVINWGSAFNLQPTNYFNPYDLRFLNSFEEKKGIQAVKGTYYSENNIEATGVITPFFDAHLMKEVNQIEQMNEFKDRVADNMLENVNQVNYNISELNMVLEQNMLPYQIEEIQTEQTQMKQKWITEDMETVADDLSNMQGGIQLLRRRAGNFDFAVSGYHGRDKIPAVNETAIEGELGAELQTYEQYLQEIQHKLETGEDPGEEISQLNSLISEIDEEVNIEPLLVYPEVNRIGFDLIGDLTEVGVWVEMSYSFYKDDQFNNRLEVAAGLDRNLDNDIYLMGQFYHQQNRQDGENDVNLVTVYLDRPVGDFHQMEVTAMYELASDTYLFEPRFNYSLADSTVWKTGLTLSESGEQTGLFGSLAEKRVFTGVQVDF